MMKMYPAANIDLGDKLPLSSFLFGHRFRTNQTPVEYLIEFLQVMLAQKTNISTCDPRNSEGMYFPYISEDFDEQISFIPHVGISLKRVIFFNHSKPEGKAVVDKDAYQDCLKVLQNHIDSDDTQGRRQLITIIQDLFYGFNATPQNRSWFDKNMLPICPEVILPEGMGVRTDRNKLKFTDPDDKDKIDSNFAYDKYTYMCRGGEVYYLHLLNGINQSPESIRESITKHFTKLIEKSFPQFSQLSQFIVKAWEDHMGTKARQPEKKLAWIPSGYSCRSKKTAKEISTLLQCDIHPFEKMKVLSDGIILQLMRAMYEQASNNIDYKCDLWIVDLCKNDPEMRIISSSGFSANEDGMHEYIVEGFENIKDKVDIFKPKDTSGKKDISDAAEVSYKLCRKLGKQLGFIIPVTGSYMRFTLNERILKFMVLSLIEPKKKVEFDQFLEMLDTHFGIVIDRETYCEHVKKCHLPPLADYSVLDRNKQAMLVLLKNCGFLRNLSDATSIVENPFEMEVI